MPDDTDRPPVMSPVNGEIGVNDGVWNLGKDQISRSIDSGENDPNSPSAAATPVMKTEPSSDDPGMSLVISDPWTVPHDPSPSASRVPFTKREKELLCSLIQKHVYWKAGRPQGGLPTLSSLNQKNAINSFCRVPNAAWKAIEQEYNSKENVRYRSVKQLRKCWENLKHRGNIDPAALYSGKKLQGRTSLSGAFTLTTEGEEIATTEAPKASTPSDGFVETCLEDENTAATMDVVSGLTPSMIPTDLSMRRRTSSNNSTSPSDNIAENLFQTQPSATKAKSPVPPVLPTSIFQFATSEMMQSRGSKGFTPETVPRLTSRIANSRTVRSLKPSLSQTIRRRFGMDGITQKSGPQRSFSNFSMVAKTNTQKIHEMKVKLLSARIKEHETNVQRVRLQMQHAQAQHDVNMRLLRTKAAWYDSHLRKLEKQMSTGDLSLVGEEEEDYPVDSVSDLDFQYNAEFA